MNAGWDLAYLGDAAVLVSPRADAALDANAEVHRLAARLRRARVIGVRDVVPGMRDLVVHFEPVRCDIDAIARALDNERDVAGEPGELTARPVVEVPVVYGGESGPDLEAVAAACGLTAEEVCRRHAASEYIVCFVGFLPGFPYLGPLDASLRLPRRTTPRPRVPAGSVAIAGEYTGIYPWPSPGGWHLIGRTDVSLFDLNADPPARVLPGDRVRFVPLQS